MSYDDAGHEGLVARLLKFEDGARQRCTCRSDLENCRACDCGLAADAIVAQRKAMARLVKVNAELRLALRPAPTKIAQAGVLEQIKLLALTAGSPGELSMHLTLSRIVRLCIDAGIKAHLVELKELHHGN